MDFETVPPPFTNLNFDLTGSNFDLSGFNFTITPELTSSLSGTNIDFSRSGTEVLSAITDHFISTLRSSMSGLSTEVIHPWDALKMTLFEPDYKFPTIDDVVIPEEVTPITIKEKIKEHEMAYRSRIFDCITNRDKYSFVGPFDQVSIISEPSGSDCFAVTQDKLKDYIETVETLRSIDPESINEDNYLDYITKINYSVARLLTRKTIS